MMTIVGFLSIYVLHVCTLLHGIKINIWVLHIKSFSSISKTIFFLHILKIIKPFGDSLKVLCLLCLMNNWASFLISHTLLFTIRYTVSMQVSGSLSLLGGKGSREMMEMNQEICLSYQLRNLSNCLPHTLKFPKRLWICSMPLKHPKYLKLIAGFSHVFYNCLGT